MGVILDSSIVITAERRGDTVSQLLKRVSAASSDQEAALSSVGLAELIHGIYRASTGHQRLRREAFIYELLDYVPVISFTKETAILAGKIDGEQQKQGVVIPTADLLIGAHRFIGELFTRDWQCSTFSTDSRASCINDVIQHQPVLLLQIELSAGNLVLRLYLPREIICASLKSCLIMASRRA